ncbi:unnamed protein product [Psylliodes chrysocephalus]|uniref:NADH dehydrogenase [ubiquinone] 1 beta subcomplex subunit 4 n=1 Tax=Psylliodes chrysocephalus TaxID=3402493 RepID=A0A9P0CWG0_9CUCU|nr:unnamed protein product [Psylliodes chrysocephala]
MSGPSTYDLTEQARNLLEQKAKRRAVLRQEYLKLKTNPFQHASGEGGAVFDPAIQRYNAMKVSGFEYFKPTGKSAVYGMGMLVIPMMGYFYLMYKQRTELEAKYRRGEVAYKDRNFKFI